MTLQYTAELTVPSGYTGGDIDVPFNFTYLDEGDIKVYKTDTTTSPLTFITQWSFKNRQEITIKSDQVTIAAGDKFLVNRETNVSDPYVTFAPGSAVRAEDLNNNQKQILFSSQEREERNIATTGDVMIGNLLMDGNKITGLKNTYSGDVDLEVYSDNTEAVSAGWAKTFFNNVTIPRIDSELASALTNEIEADDGIKITDNEPSTGNITIGINDGGIALEKINTEDVTTSTETDYTSTATGQDDGQAWVGDDSRIATLGALAKRFDNYYSTTTPAGNDYKAGTLHYNPGTAEDPDNTLFIYNGTGWEVLVSGVKDFIKQNRLIWVDAGLGNDARDGHRVVDPMKTIQAAVNKAEDGDMIFVQPGVYKEYLPIDLGRKKNVSIIGLSMRSVFVHPHPTKKWVVANTDTYAPNKDNDVVNKVMEIGPHGNTTTDHVDNTSEYETMFQLGSGSFVANMTLAGIKAQGNRGNSHTDSVALNPNPDPDPNVDNSIGYQGWFFAFARNDGDGNAVKFQKSPYVQNVTAFADSAIDNTNYQPHSTTNQPAFGGDQTSAPTGGGLLVDGSVPHPDSPLRSFLTDAFTIICLDGPGALVKNEGYAQLVSTFGHFCHYHAKAESGGMINMSNCTTDFGRFGLVADGQSADSIFEGTVSADSSNNVIQIDATTAWTERNNNTPKPVNHMVVSLINNPSSASDFYPIKAVTEPSSGVYDIELYDNVSVTDDQTVYFYLRSTITTGGHVFEFAGAGTDYRAHPDNGGNPVEANQVKSEGAGVVYISSSDHNGNFKVGDVFSVSTDSESVAAQGDLSVSGTSTLTGAVTAQSTLSVTGNVTTGGNITVGGTLDAQDLTINGSTINVFSSYFDASGDILDTAMPNKITAGTFNYPTAVTVDLQGRVTNVSTDEDRFVPTYSNNTSQYLSGNGTWQNIPAGSISLDTNQSDSSKVDIEVGSGLVTLDPGLGVSFTRSGDELTIDVSIGTAFADIVTSVPSGTGSTGQLKWNSTSSIPYIWNGSSWVQFAPLSPPYGTGSVSEVIAGIGLSGGVSNGSTTGTINLADTAVTPGTYGDADTVPQFTVDQQGRVTAIANVDIALDTSDVTTGVFDLARIPTMDAAHIPDLSANKITSDTLGVDRIPDLAAGKITSDTFHVNRIPTLSKSKISGTGTWNVSDIPDLSATYLTAVSADTTPQLGGSLDVNGNSIVSASNGNITLNPNGSGVVSFANNTGTTYVNGNYGVTIKPPTLTGDYSLTLPTSLGSANQVLSITSVDTNTNVVELGWADDADTTYSNFSGANGTNAGTAGLVPAPAATDNTKYLKGDGTWAGITVASVPTGAIMWWPGLADTGNNDDHIPSGWLECDGRIFNKTDYLGLYNVLRNKFRWQSVNDSDSYPVPGGGEYDANEHSQLPDLRGEFIRGFDNSRGVDGTRSLTTQNRAQADQLEHHNHSVGSLFQTDRFDVGGGGNSSAGTTTTGVTGTGDHTTPPNTAVGTFDGTPGSVSDETRPRNIVMVPIIKI